MSAHGWLLTGPVHQRGPITDYVDLGPDSGLGGLALCVCVHGNAWPEGDRFEDNGGKACRECAVAAYNHPSHPRFLP